MKFFVKKEVFEKFPNLVIFIPVIKGFTNKQTRADDSLDRIVADAQTHFKKEFANLDSLKSDLRVSSYSEVFRSLGLNPEKTKPTHYALASRILEGGELPNVNPVVNFYNAMSIKYITPFGGEDLEKVFGDFYLEFAKGDEHWLGINALQAKSPRKGDLIWRDSYDVSTLSLNWRQCERTKLTEKTQIGYFIMDGFAGVNDGNIDKAAKEFVETFKQLFGGESEILLLDKNNPSADYNYQTKTIEGLDLPKIVKAEKSKINEIFGKKVDSKYRDYIYMEDSPETLIQKSVFQSLSVLLNSVQLNNEFSFINIPVENTKDTKFGDYTTTVAMILSNQISKPPIEIANEIKKNLEEHFTDAIEKVEVVNPGFVNFFMKKNSNKEVLLKIDKNWGKWEIGKNELVMVEFGQPNTHKGITMGHVKSAITGLALSNLFENMGYKVIRANFFGDIGLYVANCIYGLLLHYKKDFKLSDLTEKLAATISDSLNEILRDKGITAVAKLITDSYVLGSKVYKDDEVISKEIKELNLKLYSKSDPLVDKLYDITRKMSIDFQDKFFRDLGVVYDRQYPESEVSAEALDIVEKNIGNVFIKDAGAIIFPGERHGLNRWVFITKQQLPTYSAKDLGLASLKFKEYPGLKLGLVLTSVEQVNYFKAVIKALELIKPEIAGRYKHVGFGWLLFGNKKVSSRMGNKNFGYEDMINETVEMAKSKISGLKEYSKEEVDSISKKVAVAGFKFSILSHELHKDINYDPEKFLSMTGYSAPYLMYSYARAISILDKINKVNEKLIVANLSSIYNDETELTLIKKLSEFPSITKVAAESLMPHLICNYLYELASTFTTFYTKCPVLSSEDLAVKNSRLLLLQKVVYVLKNGFGLLGIEAVEKM